MKIILKFSSKKNSKNKSDASVIVAVWQVDPIEGGILEQMYPPVKNTKDEALNQISQRIKKVINITVRDMTFKSEWSLSPITIDDHHFYLYGFFLNTWKVISIHLPIKFSHWLIETKSELLIFESQISNKATFFPQERWVEEILIPIYEEFIEQKITFESSLNN